MTFELTSPLDGTDDDEHQTSRAVLHALAHTTQAERDRAQAKVRELMRLTSIRQLPLLRRHPRRLHPVLVGEP